LLIENAFLAAEMKVKYAEVLEARYLQIELSD